MQLCAFRRVVVQLFAGHLLVNLGFGIFRFSIFEMCFFCIIYLENLVVRYRGKIIKVSWVDPGQNGGF